MSHFSGYGFMSILGYQKKICLFSSVYIFLILLLPSAALTFFSQYATELERAGIFLSLLLPVVLLLCRENRSEIPAFVLWFLLLPTVLTAFIFTGSAAQALYLGDMDFTNISEALRRTAHFQGILPTPYVSTGESGSFLGHHFSPALLLFVPFYMVWNIPMIGDALQKMLWSVNLPLNHLIYGWLLWLTLIAGLILWTRYYLVSFSNIRRSHPLLLPAAVLILAGFSGVWRLTGSFHFEILVLPLGALFIRSSSESSVKKFTFWLYFLLFLSIKEDISIYSFFWGAFLFKSGKKREGLAVAAISFLWFSAAYLLKIYISGEGGPDWSQYWLSQDFPYSTTASERFRALGFLIMSAGGTVLLAPVYAAFVILPVATIHFFSEHPWHNIYYAHYTYSLTPFLLEGIRRGFLSTAARFSVKDTYKASVPAALSLVLHFFAAASDKDIPLKKMELDVHFAEALELASYTEPGSCVAAAIPLSPLLPLDVNVYPLYKVKNNPISEVSEKCQSVYLFAEKNQGRPPYYDHSRSDSLIRDFRSDPDLFSVTERDSLILIHLRKKP